MKSSLKYLSLFLSISVFFCEQYCFSAPHKNLLLGEESCTMSGKSVRIVRLLLLLCLLSGCVQAEPTPSASTAREELPDETGISVYGQTKAAFERLEREAGADDGGAMLREAMDSLYSLNSREESLALSSDQFRALSDGLQVFEAGEVKIFAYRGSPLVFGEAGDSGYAYLQLHVGGKPRVHAIFEAEARQVWDVLWTGDGAAILYGVETLRPRQAFADRISWDGDQTKIEPAAAPHDDEWWSIPSGLDVIMRTDGAAVETYIQELDEERMVVGSGDGKWLILTWNERSMKYEVSPK